MLRLALIGKDITHSLSKKMYESLLDREFTYTLLDFQNESEILSLAELKKRFDGVSITSPYKKFFVKDLNDLSGMGIINTIRFGELENEGINTDFMAVKFILERYIHSGIKTVHILGDGAMAEIVGKILISSPIEMIQYSRRSGSLNSFENSSEEKDFSHLVINTCAREYTYMGDLAGSYHFWDMNYKMPNHQDYFQSSKVNYVDGIEQLHLQASFALKFWGF